MILNLPFSSVVTGKVAARNHTVRRNRTDGPLIKRDQQAIFERFAISINLNSGIKGFEDSIISMLSILFRSFPA